MNACKPGKKAGPRPQPLDPYEIGLEYGRAAVARGEIPSDEALAKAARIIASSRALKRLAGRRRGHRGRRGSLSHRPA